MAETLVSGAVPGAEDLGGDEEPDCIAVANTCTSLLELQNAGDGRLFAMIDGERTAVQLRQRFPWTEPRSRQVLWAFVD